MSVAIPDGLSFDPAGLIPVVAQDRASGDVLIVAYANVAARAQAAPTDSYTARLLAQGPDQVLKKIGEEATEVVLAAKGQSDERLAEESADLLFHLLVALRQRNLPLSRVMDVLKERRRGK